MMNGDSQRPKTSPFSQFGLGGREKDSWRHPGNEMDSSWQQPGQAADSSWQEPGQTAGSDWQQAGQFGGSGWQQPGQSMNQNWQPPGRPMEPGAQPMANNPIGTRKQIPGIPGFSKRQRQAVPADSGRQPMGRQPDPVPPQRGDRERKISSEVLFGDHLYRENIPAVRDVNPMVVLSGADTIGRQVMVPMSAGTLGKHIMLLGGIGTGKTNAFNQILDQMRMTMAEDSVAIIFDTKGDFYRTFARPGDVVISNDETAKDYLNRANYWNIFRELPTDDARLMENLIEISKGLFAEACERTNQPFFPNAARDIFTATMWHFMKSKPPIERTNRHLSNFLFSATTAELRQMLYSYPMFRAMVSYIQSDSSAQTQGVLAELQQVIRQIFVGNFNKHGTLSLRQLTKEKKGRFIFIEYDLSLGSMLTPIYTLMFDLAIKESICRERTPGNVFFVADEFRLLPNLEHIDDAVNFGRSLGVKFMIGVQNVEQVYENYGEERARSIMSGFLTNFNFRVNDHRSREHVKEIYGKNRKKDSFRNTVATKGLIEESREGYVVEDWDITNLEVGQAIIGLPGKEPFVFKFDRFDEEEYIRRKNIRR